MATISPLTKKDISAIAKKQGVKKLTRMTAAEYREALKKKGNIAPKKDKNNKRTFAVPEYKIEKIHGGYVVTLIGKTFSRNVTNKFSLGDEIRYKKSVMQGAKNYWLLNRSFVRSLVPMQKATVMYVFYNRVSRDWDNQSPVIKPFQDTFTKSMLGIIEDDSKKHLQRALPPQEEVLGKTYKVEAYIFEGIHPETIRSSPWSCG